MDATGRIRQLECRGTWTGLDHARTVLGTAPLGAEARLRAARARFGGGQAEAVQGEAQRLLGRHGLAGARINTAALEAASGTVVWVARGATDAGEAVTLHLEPLSGKLVAFHVGGAR